MYFIVREDNRDFYIVDIENYSVLEKLERKMKDSFDRNYEIILYPILKNPWIAG